MSKKLWSECISMLMAAVMLFSIFAETGITAFAEHSSTNTVSTVEVTIQEELLAAGKTYTDAEYKLLSSLGVTSGNCTVESIQWERPDGTEMQENEQLSYRYEYIVMITLKANGTNRFDENATVAVNGSEERVLVVNRYDQDGYSNLQFTWTFSPKAKEFINSFAFFNVPEATPNAMAEHYNYTHTLGGEEKYTVTGHWNQYNSATCQYEPMANTDVFQDEGAYQLVLHTDMKPGYVIHDDDPLHISVDNRSVEVEYSDEFGWIANLYESFGTAIQEVRFTVPEPVKGQQFSDATPIIATVPSGSNYTVKGNWVEEETGSCVGTFTKGKSYYFAYTVYAGDGYYLAENVAVFINGRLDEILFCNGKIGSSLYRKTMKTLISEVALIDVPKAELGKSFQTGEFTIKVPAGAKYKARGCWHESGVPVTSGQAESGKEYELSIILQADSGYEFAEQYILKINGTAHQGDGGSDVSYYYVPYSFLKRIHQIKVTGVVEPKVGQVPDIASLRSAAPAKYEITQVQWIDLGTGELATVFEDGHTYHLMVEVIAKQGYTFEPNISWEMGKDNGTGEPYVTSWCCLSTEYSFAKVIPKIEINNIPTVKVGKMPQTELKVPVNAKYTARAEWRVWDDRTEMWEPFSGAFQKEKTYIVAIAVYPETGYRFDSDITVCYLDGVLDKKMSIRTLEARGEVKYAAKGTKTIHKVEVTISKPAVGDHSSVEPVITLPKGVNYHLRQGTLWLEGNVEKNEYVNNCYFGKDGNYGVRFRLIADENYMFAEDLMVVVNGIVLFEEAFSTEVKYVDTNYFFNMKCQHSKGSAATCTKKAVCAICGQQYGELLAHTYKNGKCTVCDSVDPDYVCENEDIPNTGDNSNTILWIALLFVSGMGIFGIILNDRKREV